MYIRNLKLFHFHLINKKHRPIKHAIKNKTKTQTKKEEKNNKHELRRVKFYIALKK